MKTIEEIVAANLVALRGHRSQATMSEAIGIPLRTYQTYEAGRIPQGPNRRAICDYFNISESRLCLDPEFTPTPTNRQIIDAVNEALMERDMLRTAMREGAINRSSKTWTRMIQAGLGNHHIVETAEEQSKRERATEGLTPEAKRAMREADKLIHEDEEQERPARTRQRPKA